MTDANRLRWTRFIVIAGVLLGYATYGTYKLLGWSELYPFASWRLYSAPVGINEPAKTYRIYWLNPDSDTWIRQSFRPRAHLSRKDQGYLLSYWAAKIIENPANDEARHRLKVITNTLAPDAPAYRVVEETFYSIPFYTDTTRYDTSTVVRFGR